VYRARVASLRRLIEALEFEIELFAGMARARLARDPGYTAIRAIPGIGGCQRILKIDPSGFSEF
jgi:hypothetical protein